MNKIIQKQLILGWTKNGSPGQKWEMKGNYIYSQLNNMVLSVKGGVLTPNSQIGMWDMVPDTIYQMWYFEQFGEYK